MKLNEQETLLHYYEGCQIPEYISTQLNSGIGNMDSGVIWQPSLDFLDTVEEIQAYYPDYDYKYNLLPGWSDDIEVLSNNNNVIHEEALGPGLQPGQVIKVATCGVYPHCSVTCLKYVGTTTDSSNIFTYGGGANLDTLSQDSTFYDSCQECAGTDLEDEYIFGCMDDGENWNSPNPGIPACNYNPDADFPSGNFSVQSMDYSNCDYSCVGCMNPEADNYDPNATAGYEWVECVYCDSSWEPYIDQICEDDPTFVCCPGNINPEDNEEDDSEQVPCYKCQNGSPVGYMFPDPPGCPKGWNEEVPDCEEESGNPSDFEDYVEKPKKSPAEKPLNKKPEKSKKSELKESVIKRLQKLAGIKKRG
jgi:hypothetical protein